jgi:hypothetical protein
MLFWSGCLHDLNLFVFGCQLERIQSLSTRLGACEAVLQEGESPELVAQQLAQMVKSDLFRDLKAQSMLVEAYLASGKYIQADEASRFSCFFSFCLFGCICLSSFYQTNPETYFTFSPHIRKRCDCVV